SNAGETPHYDLWGGYSYYWSCLTGDYQVGIWSVLAVLVLLGVGAWACGHKRLQPGARAIFLLIALAVLLCTHHPNRKSRFLHSWLALTWVAAGAGAGYVLRPRSSPGGLVLRPAFAALVTGVAAFQVPVLADLARPPGRGPRPACPSVLELTDGYLPFLQDSRHAAVFANVPLKFLVLWTDMQRYGRSHTLDTDVKGFDSHKSDNRPCLDAWLARTSCDTIVYVDIPTESPLHFAPPGS